MRERFVCLLTGRLIFFGTRLDCRAEADRLRSAFLCRKKVKKFPAGTAGGIRKRRGNGADHVWIDAGWHGGFDAACKDEFTDEWSRQTGDWRVNAAIHPDGLQCVSEAARRNGFGLSLWFEPERAHSCVPAVARHPAWFLRTEGDDFRNLLRLDDPQAFASVFGMLCERIKELGITCYRQDFNMDPLPLWDQYDEPGRKGILQNQARSRRCTSCGTD